MRWARSQRRRSGHPGHRACSGHGSAQGHGGRARNQADHARELGRKMGAGDGNRTRTVSLGICPIRGSDRPDLGTRCTASDRQGPCDTGSNGPPMARAKCPGLVRNGQPRVLHDACGQLACCDACQPDCDCGRRRPKTKYKIGTTPAELTTATKGAHSHFGPRIWLAGRRLMSMRAATLRMPSTTATVMISLRVLSSRSLHVRLAAVASSPYKALFLIWELGPVVPA